MKKSRRTNWRWATRVAGTPSLSSLPNYWRHKCYTRQHNLKNKEDESDLLLRFAEGYSKAVVTGGAGFIGSHLCEFLVRSGVEVICLDDFSAGYRRNIQHLLDYRNFRVAKCDITDMESLSKIFDGVDIVFHNAAAKKTVCLSITITLYIAYSDGVSCLTKKWFQQKSLLKNW